MNEFDLGDIVLKCRPRVRFGAWLESGSPPIPILLAPIVVAFVLTLLPIIISQKYFQVPAPAKDPTVAAVTTFWFVVWIVIGYAYIFSAPSSGSLVVYENGFTYRGRSIPFAAIAYVTRGLAPSTVRDAANMMNEMLAPVSHHARSAAAMAEAREASSLTIGLIDGSHWTWRVMRWPTWNSSWVT